MISAIVMLVLMAMISGNTIAIVCFSKEMIINGRNIYDLIAGCLGVAISTVFIVTLALSFTALQYHESASTTVVKEAPFDSDKLNELMQEMNDIEGVTAHD